MMNSLADKTALITGASQGIGKGIACELAIAGANIVITYFDNPTDHENAESTIAQIQSLGGNAIAVAADVTQETSIKQCVELTVSHFSGLDILINNAGVMQQTKGLHTPVEEFSRCHTININGTWRMAIACAPHLKACGEGRIINISSGAGRRGSADLPAYSASKAAMISLTQSLALALAPDNITVNTLCPGVIWTPMCQTFAGLMEGVDSENAVNKEKFIQDIKETIPLQRPQTAEDIGHAVVFFASSGAKNITGQALNIDGGINMN